MDFSDLPVGVKRKWRGIQQVILVEYKGAFESFKDSVSHGWLAIDQSHNGLIWRKKSRDGFFGFS